MLGELRTLLEEHLDSRRQALALTNLLDKRRELLLDRSHDLGLREEAESHLLELLLVRKLGNLDIDPVLVAKCLSARLHELEARGVLPRLLRRDERDGELVALTLGHAGHLDRHVFAKGRARKRDDARALGPRDTARVLDEPRLDDALPRGNDGAVIDAQILDKLRAQNGSFLCLLLRLLLGSRGRRRGASGLWSAKLLDRADHSPELVPKRLAIEDELVGLALETTLLGWHRELSRDDSVLAGLDERDLELPNGLRAERTLARRDEHGALWPRDLSGVLDEPLLDDLGTADDLGLVRVRQILDKRRAELGAERLGSLALRLLSILARFLGILARFLGILARLLLSLLACFLSLLACFLGILARLLLSSLAGESLGTKLLLSLGGTLGGLDSGTLLLLLGSGGSLGLGLADRVRNLGCDAGSPLAILRDLDELTIRILHGSAVRVRTAREEQLEHANARIERLLELDIRRDRHEVALIVAIPDLGSGGLAARIDPLQLRLKVRKRVLARETDATDVATQNNLHSLRHDACVR